ncbi:polyprenyl synthetase family protein [Desulfothermus naphthae]
MNERDLKNTLKVYKTEVDKFLKRYFKSLHGVPSTLKESMEYSVMAGGKRIRPILCMVCYELFTGSISEILPFASALELIHTYSLIHDDLPAMDNDDFRRGKPTNHKLFGEAIAILAGDGLLTDSIRLMLMCDVSKELLIKAMNEIIGAVGSQGMVGGQVIDIELTGKESCTLDELRQMHMLKTGRFIESACVCGAILGDASKSEILKIREYGKMIGLAFQIADDILDIEGDEKIIGKPIHSDLDKGKCTYPLLLGIEESKRLGWECVKKAISFISEFNSPKVEFLKDLARYIMIRTR